MILLELIIMSGIMSLIICIVGAMGKVWTVATVSFAILNYGLLESFIRNESFSLGLPFVLRQQDC